ncbi:hypothetical protein [Algimonas arctica]|nr:hypothetical protein [Algimonas arctica]
MVLSADLPSDVTTLQAGLMASEARNARLESQVASFRQAMFGPKSTSIS